MEVLFIFFYSLLGLYYFLGVLTYIYIYIANVNKHRIYLNATRFNRLEESDLDGILEENNENIENSDDLSYAGY